jgi:hypothetical protein
MTPRDILNPALLKHLKFCSYIERKQQIMVFQIGIEGWWSGLSGRVPISDWNRNLGNKRTNYLKVLKASHHISAKVSLCPYVLFH